MDRQKMSYFPEYPQLDGSGKADLRLVSRVESGSTNLGACQVGCSFQELRITVPVLQFHRSALGSQDNRRTGTARYIVPMDDNTPV